MPRRKDVVADIHSFRHANKRPDLTAEKLRGFVDDEEQKPKPILYPRVRRSIAK